jgi:hypothetical protein
MSGMSEVLKAAAKRAGIVDLDALALADTSKDDGSIANADAIVAALREAKPFLFPPKMARDMSEAERSEALAAIKRGPPPIPVETTKRATEMSEQERREYLREHARRFG